MPDYARFTEALAQGANQPETAFTELCRLTGELIGMKLFTLMTFDAGTGIACRIYSNMPEAYPVTGTKMLERTEWSRHVLEEQRIFVANTIEGIARVFSDHALIRSLGCESVINVPAIAGGEVLGTINCLHEAGFYTEARVAAAEALKLPAAASFLLHERKTLKGGRE
jgi:GAF domain-containing protein